MIARLPDEEIPKIDVQAGGMVGVYQRDDAAVNPVDEYHGFLLTTTQAIGVAEELMACAGEIVGEDAAVTIWAETISTGEAIYAGQRSLAIVASDRDGRTVRIAMPPESARQIAQQLRGLTS